MTPKHAWVLALFALLASCSKTTDPLPDKNTNWLRACSSDSTCGYELSCVCGVCTRACTAAADCRANDRQTPLCESTSGSALRPQCEQAGGDVVGAICVPACKLDVGCEPFGEGWSCSPSGACVAPTSTSEPMSMEPQELDASTGVTEPSSNGPDSGRDGGQPQATTDSGSPLDSGPPPERLCGNGTIELDERCDQTEPFPHGHCDERCAIVCDPGYSDCDGDLVNGCERDVSATPDAPAGPGNLGAGCVEVLLDGQAGPTSIALDTTHVYWTNLGTREPLGDYNFDGTVMAMPLAGGEPVVLAENQGSPGQLVVAGGYLYWINAPYGEMTRDGAVMRVPLSGGPPEVVAHDLLNTFGLAVDDSYAYFFTSQIALASWSLWRVNKGGTGVPDRLLTNLPSWASTIALADGQLYWSSNGLVQTMPSDGSGGVRDLADSRSAYSQSPADLVLDGDRLFWLFDSGTSTGLGSALRTGVETGVLVELESTYMAYGLALDAQYAYWAHQSDRTGALWLIERSDKQLARTTVVLADAVLNNPQLAANDTALYIAVAGSSFEPSGMLLKLAK